MNCNEIRVAIRAQDFRPDPALARHLDQCALCGSWFENERLAVALAHDPIPEPSRGFVDRALTEAARQPERNMARTTRYLTAAAAAVVLAVTAWLATFVVMPDRGLVSSKAMEAKLIRVIIDVKEERRDALLTIQLAEDLELEGFEGQRFVSWRADVPKGRNLLALPVMVKPGAGGDIHVALSYGGETRTSMRIPVDA